MKGPRQGYFLGDQKTELDYGYKYVQDTISGFKYLIKVKIEEFTF